VTPGLSGLIPAEAYEGITATIPLGRMGTPDDMGKTAVFLASDDSAFITGVQLDVDGGVAQY
jgi:NAD(P)-dependent dehydrogenase (short-subunit alcohol dehydrogenase family)